MVAELVLKSRAKLQVIAAFGHLFESGIMKCYSSQSCKQTNVPFQKLLADVFSHTTQDIIAESLKSVGASKPWPGDVTCRLLMFDVCCFNVCPCL